MVATSKENCKPYAESLVDLKSTCAKLIKKLKVDYFYNTRKDGDLDKRHFINLNLINVSY